ncbi:hypothetical protein LTR36_001192 [Oleoguttula mirabilis]|uniref:Fe2OG dioxygenase domain-containing protein n=1 Tax=Oleoguttula mirabilis TaxID=1507867 RepID=A0AAV9J3L7_9PEZI|nr:hypothetical protein LTR36_001192 [Oleoguttula mirabilis]
MVSPEHFTGEVQIPVIDIRPTNSDAPRQLLQAAAGYGFVFIEPWETGIKQEDVDQMFELSKEFFASPIDVKEEVSISSNKAGKNYGWLSQGVEKLDPMTQKRPDVKEAFNVGEPVGGELQQPLPKPLRPHEQTIIDFQRKCHRLCQRVLQVFAIALGINERWFTDRHDEARGPSGTMFRLLYYPQIDTIEDGVDIRAGAHSDYGSITLLFQQRGGHPGLEIKTPSGEWAPVPVDPVQHPVGSFNGGIPKEQPLPILVNIGDLLEDWTAGLLKSTVHRVIFPEASGGDRYSIAYFCHPLDDALLEPVPSKLVEDHALKSGRKLARDGKLITAKDHLMARLAATYTVK